MFGSRVRVLAAAMVLAVALGAALPTADHHGLAGLAGLERGADRSSVVLADSSPLGVVASAVRVRTSLDTASVLDVGWTKSGAGGVAWPGTLGLGAAALGWWLRRRDRGADVASPRRSPAALRAPPRPASV
jgi:hypothetical protein